MKNSKKTLQDLNNVQEDLNKILSLIDNLDEIDENTNIEILDKEIDSMGKQMEEKYKDLLSEDNLDSEK
tara:strand:- start:204 stop:410 length:207 start_codon:yes stop_codon:yes gene_type:complete